MRVIIKQVGVMHPSWPPFGGGGQHCTTMTREYGNRIHEICSEKKNTDGKNTSLHLDNALLPNKLDIANTKKIANHQIIEQHCETQGRRRCLAAGVLDIWHCTDHEGVARKYLARHGSTRSWHGTAQDIPDNGNTYVLSSPPTEKT